MEVKLNLPNRFAVLGIMPAEGNILTIRTVKGVKNKMIPTEAEQKDFGIETLDDGRIKWNAVKGAALKAFQLSDAEFGMVASELRKLEQGNKLKEEQLDIFEIFAEKRDMKEIPDKK